MEMKCFKKKTICPGWVLNWFSQCKSSYYLTVPGNADIKKIKDYLKKLPGARDYLIEADTFNGKEIYFHTSLGFKDVFAGIVSEFNLDYEEGVKKKPAPSQLNISKRKPVVQYTLDGELVREWESCTQVSAVLGYNQGHLSNATRGIKPTAYGYIWKFKSSY